MREREQMEQNSYALLQTRRTNPGTATSRESGIGGSHGNTSLIDSGLGTNNLGTASHECGLASKLGTRSTTSNNPASDSIVAPLIEALEKVTSRTSSLQRFLACTTPVEPAPGNKTTRKVTVRRLDEEPSACQCKSVKRFILVWLESDDTYPRIISDILWSHLLTVLIFKRAQLEAENAFCSTLGAAYATLKVFLQARQFAERSLRIAEELGDTVLALKSKIHIALAQIYEDQFDGAQSSLAALTKQAEQLKDAELLGKIQYAETMLQNRKDNFRKREELSTTNKTFLGQ